MRGPEAVRPFLEQLRAQIAAEYPDRVAPADPELLLEALEPLLETSFTAEARQQPSLQKLIADTVRGLAADAYAVHDANLARIQQNIERTAQAQVEGPVDLSDLSPLIGYLPTGQLNAVTMLTPRGHLVLFEDELVLFIEKICRVMIWALPAEDDGAGGARLVFSTDAVMERLDREPVIDQWFTALVIAYTLTGSVASVPGLHLPPAKFLYAGSLATAVSYFIIAHEYGHILCGHLEETAPSRAVLPIDDVEALRYSWGSELDADVLGTVFAVNALIQHERLDFSEAYLGICVFFGVLDVMDRAVAVLATGDENARQVGSHPPSDMRKREVREFLPKMAGKDPALHERVRAALSMGDFQDRLIERLWRRARPMMHVLREAGARPAPVWRVIAREG